MIFKRNYICGRINKPYGIFTIAGRKNNLLRPLKTHFARAKMVLYARWAKNVLFMPPAGNGTFGPLRGPELGILQL